MISWFTQISPPPQELTRTEHSPDAPWLGEGGIKSYLTLSQCACHRSIISHMLLCRSLGSPSPIEVSPMTLQPEAAWVLSWLAKARVTWSRHLAKSQFWMSWSCNKGQKAKAKAGGWEISIWLVKRDWWGPFPAYIYLCQEGLSIPMLTASSQQSLISKPTRFRLVCHLLQVFLSALWPGDCGLGDRSHQTWRYGLCITPASWLCLHSWIKGWKRQPRGHYSCMKHLHVGQRHNTFHK